MPVPGAIAARTQGILPVTWDGLSRDSRYGDSFLQAIIDLAKESVFGTVSAPVIESTYSLVVVDYVAKVAAIELCTAGIDFWMSEPIGIVATGTSENVQYTDRATQLKELQERLLKETRKIAGDIADLVGYTRPMRGRIPLSSTMNDEFLTPSPQEFPRPYVRSGRS